MADRDLSPSHRLATFHSCSCHLPHPHLPPTIATYLPLLISCHLPLMLPLTLYFVAYCLFAQLPATTCFSLPQCLVAIYFIASLLSLNRCHSLYFFAHFPIAQLGKPSNTTLRILSVSCREIICFPKSSFK